VRGASKCGVDSFSRVLAELLRPPPHRGPLIAAGAVVLATGLAVGELRIDAGSLAPIWHFLALGIAGGITFALGLQAPNEGGKPPAYQSVLLVTGLLLLYPALLRLADVLGAELTDGFPAGELTWVSLVEAGLALYAGLRRRSAICLLIAAIAAGVALLSGWQWVFGNDTFTASRWLLLVTSIALALVSLVLRAGSPRQAELMVDGAALAILAIGLQALGNYVLQSISLFGSTSGPILPGFWEFTLLAAGCGAIAFGAIERSPGPAWLGVANLVAFVVVTGLESEATLYWWPLALILLGVVGMAAGLRPREPLPPEPDAYRAGDAPIASRSVDDEPVYRVRDDSAPTSVRER
jgi:hypothetical protein